MPRVARIFRGTGVEYGKVYRGSTLVFLRGAPAGEVVRHLGEVVTHLGEQVTIGGVPGVDPPIASPDARNLSASEITVDVPVLDNDVNVEGATVSVVSETGIDAEPFGNQIRLTRIGTAAGPYTVTYRATTGAGSADAVLSGSVEALALPIANDDTRSILASETTVDVNVLGNDENVGGGTVTIVSESGIDASVVGSQIRLTRIGTAAGSYTVTYRVTTPVGSDDAVLSGSVAAVDTGSVGPVEAVNTSLPLADRPTITAANGARQTWDGYGYGLGVSADAFADRTFYQTHQAALFDELNTKVIRLHNPEGANFVSEYKPLVDFAVSKGVDRILVTGYVWRTINTGGSATPTSFANAVSAAITAGIPITHVCLQNEPDGAPNHNGVSGAWNAPPSIVNPTTGALTASMATGLANQLVADMTTLRNRLNILGHQVGGPSPVVVIGLEWAHFGSDGETEYNLLNAAGAIPSSVGIGAGHCYKDCPANGLYDSRWGDGTKPHGKLPLWSTETGNAGSPNCQARFVAALNHGAAVEMMHVGAESNPAADQAQILVGSGGTKRPYHGAVRVISSALPRGTVMRLCTSTDRPSGLDVNFANRMIRDGGQNNPRHQVAAGRKADGRWVIVAVNATEGVDAPSSFLGAHYAAATQQLTVNVIEMAGMAREFTARRADINGVVSGFTTVNMQDGLIRFTLAAGETISLEEVATDEAIPANALDRSAYASTAAWIDDMNAQGRPGKVGPGTYSFTSRQSLTQSIYGYGAPTPVFRNAARTNSFLFVRADNVSVSRVRFENIEMPFISVDDTESTDWGDGLVPRSSYGYMMPEWSQSSLYHNSDLVNCSITNCEFDGCGVLFMGIRHFRVHNGLNFSDNVVTNGMAGVCLLGYRFQNIVFDRNSFTNMVGTRYAASSANNTETLLLLGGINILDDAQIALSNQIFVRHNVGLNYTSSHGPNDKNAAVFMDVRGGSGITVEDNDVRNFYNTGGSHDSNAVYLKSKGNIRFRRNYWENIGAKPTATSMGSEAAYYEFKGGSDDITSEDDQFIGGAQSGDAPWIAAGTASNVILTRPIIRGWRQTQSSWGGPSGRPGQPCIIHHWGGSVCRVIDADVDDCLRTAGPTAYLIAHRNDAAGVCNHSGWRSGFNANQISQLYKGGSPATVSLTDCLTKTGQTITITTGPS